MKDIAELRRDIDEIDDKIAELFLKRMDMMEDIAEAKKGSSASISDPARERLILSRVTNAVGEKHEDAARLLFRTMFGITKARQRVLLNGESEFSQTIKKAVAATSDKFPKRALVACPGVEGAYAQQAASRMFALPTIVYFNDFDKIFESVEKGLCPSAKWNIPKSSHDAPHAAEIERITRAGIASARKSFANKILLKASFLLSLSIGTYEKYSEKADLSNEKNRLKIELYIKSEATKIAMSCAKSGISETSPSCE